MFPVQDTSAFQIIDYWNYTYVMQQFRRFLDEVYMHKRINSALGYLAPAEFASQWKQQSHQFNIH